MDTVLCLDGEKAGLISAQVGSSLRGIEQNRVDQLTSAVRIAWGMIHSSESDTPELGGKFSSPVPRNFIKLKERQMRHYKSTICLSMSLDSSYGRRELD